MVFMAHPARLSSDHAHAAARSWPASSLALVALLASAFFLLGCPGQIITNVPTVEDADDQQSTCKVARDPLNPLVVEWPGTAKVDLEATSNRGLVAVSYAGCTMKILTNCQIEGTYEMEPTTPARDRIEISDANELYAKLPLGAASLKAELSLDSALELDYIAVGQRIASNAPKASDGDCTDATHYIRTITVGAFKLDARAKGKVGAEVGVGSAGAGIGRTEQARKLRSQGDVEECAKAPSGPDCGAILQLGLAPLNRNKGKTLASAGFGEGLDPVAQLETIDALELDATATTNLASVDVDLYELLNTAVKAEKNTNLAAIDRVRAWELLASYTDKNGKNSLKSTADERLDAWRIREAQERRQQEALNRLKERYIEDKTKLDRLLAMDADVIKPEQKVAYQTEFNEVYGARKKELASVGLGGASGGNSGGSGGDAPSTPFALESGLAGFGFLAIEAEIGYAAQAEGIITASGGAVDGRKGQMLGEGGLNDSGVNAGAVPGPVMVGVMISTPELLPGAFCKDADCFAGGLGLYGSFRAFVAGNAPTMTFAGGARFDYRIGESVVLNLGGGGGYGILTGEYEIFDPATNLETGELLNPVDCTGTTDVCGDGLGGAVADFFAGIGYSDRLFQIGFRSTLDLLFLGGGFNTSDGPVTIFIGDTEASALLTFSLGANIGITL